MRAFAAGPALGGELSFARGVASLRYEWALGHASEPDRTLLVTRALYGRGSDSLPLDEAFLPGGGPEPPFPLRAHRQFEGGVAESTPLGRSLMLLNTEVRRTLLSRGPLHLGGVLFYDAALVVARPGGHAVAARCGGGPAVRVVGDDSVRIDWGHGLTDGANAWTLGVGQAF